MFSEKNPVTHRLARIKNTKHPTRQLPLDYRHRGNELHYEAVLQAILLNDLKNGKHKNIFGEYDYFVPFFPTSSQKEIDVLLFRHEAEKIMWYEILELKKSSFSEEELDNLMDYEGWLINSLAGGNDRMVHSIGIANRFDDKVKKYIKGRMTYGGKRIRLVEYNFNKKIIQFLSER
jgi:hypothetical protein